MQEIILTKTTAQSFNHRRPIDGTEHNSFAKTFATRVMEYNLSPLGGNNNVTQQPEPIETPSFTRQRGFTLIEILLVVAIIALLAVIAIPQFISYRSQAIDTQLKSDLRNAAVAIEGYFAKHSVYPSSISEIQGYGFQATDGVTLTLVVVTPSTYTITAAKSGGTQASFTFTSSTGSIN
jgi:type IV pilus assembly protein PilA